MTEVNCPTCGAPMVIGIPRDATVEELETGDGVSQTTDGLTKTRIAHCPESHPVAVTFSMTEPDGP